jgi:ElaB/YqjD/DUF883 family membrane-anchored ribosome-binding protein
MNNSNKGAAQPAKNKTAHTADQPAGTLELVKDELKTKFSQLEDKAAVYKEKVSDNLLGAAETVHEKSDSAQDYLNQKADNLVEFTHQKADSVNEFAHQTIGKANHLGHRAAEALNTSSDYVRNFDFEDARTQLQRTIQQKPELSIAIAGIFGFAIGLLISRRAR